MVAYVADPETGAPLCPDCATAGCRTDGAWCEDEHCRCPCRTDRAADLDAARPGRADRRTVPESAVTTVTAEPVTYQQWLRHRHCGRKVIYQSKLDANWRVLQIWATGAQAAAYCCRYQPAHWHVTSQEVP